MNREEQNNILKTALSSALRGSRSVPEDIGEVYRNWVVNIANNVNANQQPVQQEQEGQEQEEANA